MMVTEIWNIIHWRTQRMKWLEAQGSNLNSWRARSEFSEELSKHILRAGNLLILQTRTMIDAYQNSNSIAAMFAKRHGRRNSQECWEREREKERERERERERESPTPLSDKEISTEWHCKTKHNPLIKTRADTTTLSAWAPGSTKYPN